MTPSARVARIEAECSGVWAESGVTAWEREFLRSITGRPTLSPKQEDSLVKIERKVFPDCDEDDDIPC